MQQYADGYFLTRDSVQWFWSCYLPDHELENPLAAPTRGRLGRAARRDDWFR
jgi:alpha/beta hydrolase fold